MLYQAQVQIGHNFPVQLVLLSNGTIVFIRVAPVGCIIDMDDNAMFTDENLTIGNEDLWYNTIYTYKDKPDLLKWLQRQNLIEPR